LGALRSPLTKERLMTIDKRGTIGKMIDTKKVVYQCLRCDRKHIGDKDTNLKYCPKCKEPCDEPILVIVENLIVRK
jgi:Zn finger protein HypA/HybF involved in hydrogenase expression